MAADNVWPELLAGEADTIDTLIARLNAATAESGLVFEKDALDIERPEDWGAVELVNTKDEWADGKIIDRTYVLDVWAAVSDRGSDWLGKVEQVYLDYGDLIWYRLAERGYLHDVKKSLWRWRVEIDMSRTPEDEEDCCMLFETVWIDAETQDETAWETVADASVIREAFKAGKCVTVHLVAPTNNTWDYRLRETWIRMIGYAPEIYGEESQHYGEEWIFVNGSALIDGRETPVSVIGAIGESEETGKLRFSNRGGK